MGLTRQGSGVTFLTSIQSKCLVEDITGSWAWSVVRKLHLDFLEDGEDEADSPPEILSGSGGWGQESLQSPVAVLARPAGPAHHQDGRPSRDPSSWSLYLRGKDENPKSPS